MSIKPNSNTRQLVLLVILGVIIGATAMMYIKDGVNFLKNKGIVIGLAATIFGLILLLNKNAGK